MKRKNIIIITIVLIIIAAILYGFTIFKSRQNAARENGQVYGFREFLNIGSLNMFGPGGENLNTDFEPPSEIDTDNNGIADNLEDRNRNGIPDGLEDQNGNRIIDQFERPDGSGYITRPSGIPILLLPGVNPDYSNPNDPNINNCGITNFSVNGSVTIALSEAGTVNLAWSTENCEYVTISNFEGELPSSGSTSFNTTSSEVLTLSAYPNGPSAQISIYISEDIDIDNSINPIDPNPRCAINNLTANGSYPGVTVAKGTSVNISWSSTNCEYVTISGFSNQSISGNVNITANENTSITATGYPTGNSVVVNIYIDELWGGDGDDFNWDYGDILAGCRADDINIKFTEEEIQRLNVLQKMYDEIANSLYATDAVNAEIDNYLNYVLDKERVQELLSFCSSRAPLIADANLKRRVPTPFWNNPSSEVETFTNIKVYNSDHSNPNNGQWLVDNPKNIVTLVERMFRINIW